MTQPTAPAGAADRATLDESDPRRWWTLAVLCACLVLITIDTTILNVAIPTLGRTVAGSTGELQWIVDAYTVVFAGLLLTCGALGDRYGRRRALAAGLVVFGLGCLASAVVTTAGWLIAMRALTGVGAALIFPATLSIITNAFRDAVERQKAIAVWAGTAGIGIALGPLTGGLLLEHFYWGSIFLVNLPLVALALVGLALAVPESRDPEHRRLDPLGAVLSVAGLGTLVYGVIRGGSDGWIDAVTVATLVAGVVLIVMFARHEARTPSPLIDVHVFRNPRFTGASAAVAATYFCLFGTIFLLTQHLQLVMGYGTLAAGIRTVPFALTLLVVANTTPRIVARVGARVPIVTGCLVIAASQVARMAATPDTGYGVIFVSQVMFAVGMGLLVAPATGSIMGALPPARAGVGSAMNDTARQVGGALGVAVMGSVASAGYRHAFDDRVAPVAGARRALADAHHSLGAALATGDGALAQAGRASFISGLRWASLAAVVVALVGAAAAWRLLPAGAPTPAARPVGTNGSDRGSVPARDAGVAAPARPRADAPRPPAELVDAHLHDRTAPPPSP